MRATDGTGQQGHTNPRHAWVRIDDHAAPAIILDQRRTPTGWEVYCVWAVGGQSHTGWVPASDVRVAD